MTQRLFHLHLVSDSTGETVSTVARAVVAQFEDAQPIEHSWALVRTRRQIERVLDAIRAHPGVVLYTVVETELSALLEDGCREINIPCIGVLDRVMEVLSATLGAEIGHQPGRQHILDEEYYRRIEAMQFVVEHDDGQHLGGLGRADVILVGVSRTSKTPTCIYLANRGVKAANVPFVSRNTFPENEIARAGPLVVGLTANSERLIQIRRSRLEAMQEDKPTDYVDLEAVRAEINEARRMFVRRGWPLIDVSRRSIEETSAAILELWRNRAEAG
jgi:regulator of PEP synthase PpsR (kinase-PPPase family)